MRYSKLFWLFIIIIALLNVYFSHELYPLYGTDSGAFVPAAIEHKASGNLTNHLYSKSEIVDQKGTFRFLYYVPLFPLSISLIMPNAKPESATLVLGLLCAANTLALGVLLILFSNRCINKNNHPLRLFSLLVLIILSFSTWNSFSTGRPEILAILFIIISIIILIKFRTRYLFIQGLILGFMFLTHVVASLIWTTIIICFLSYFFSGPKVIYNALIIFISCGLVSLLILLLQDYSLSELFYGLKQHSSTAIFRDNSYSSQSYIYYLTFNPNTSFYGIILILSLVGFIIFLLNSHNKLKSKSFFYFSFIITLFLFFYFGIRNPHTNYNVFVFLPLLFTFILYLSSKINSNKKFSNLIFIVLVFSFLLTSSGYFWRLVQFNIYKNEGLDYNEAKKQLILSDYLFKDRMVGVSTSLWPLFDNYSNVRLIEGENINNFDFLLIQQNYSGGLSPPAIKGFDRIYDNFINKAPEIFGLKIGNTIPGYQYALYKNSGK